jgi:hypothetical protein
MLYVLFIPFTNVTGKLNVSLTTLLFTSTVRDSVPSEPGINENSRFGIGGIIVSLSASGGLATEMKGGGELIFPKELTT